MNTSLLTIASMLLLPSSTLFGESSFSDLVSQATPFTDYRVVPGGPGGIFNWDVENKAYLKTNSIKNLPYSSHIRKPTKVSIPQSTDDVPIIEMKSVSNVILVSEHMSGSAGLIRVGELKDGTPVAVKTYRLTKGYGPQFFREVQGSTVLSQLGIGPRFHGVFMDDDGRMNYVIDIIPGDLKKMPVTAKTLSDLTEIERRLVSQKIGEIPDLEVYYTREGRPLLIDPSGVMTGIENPQTISKLQQEFQKKREKLSSQLAIPSNANACVADLSTIAN